MGMISWRQIAVFVISLAGVIAAQQYTPAAVATVTTFAALALNYALGHKVGRDSLPPPAKDPEDKDEDTDPETPESKSILGG